jgi:hypothetical protein
LPDVAWLAERVLGNGMPTPQPGGSDRSSAPPDGTDWRRYCGRATAAQFLVPGLRTVRLSRPAHARSAPRRLDLKPDPVGGKPREH